MTHNQDLSTDVLRDSRIPACVQLLERVGAQSFELRFSEAEDEGSPLVWIAIAEYPNAPHQVAAHLSPYLATYRLLEQLIDGGQCTHCQHPTGISDDLDQLPADGLICWYVYDPELKTFRRGCEGSNR